MDGQGTFLRTRQWNKFQGNKQTILAPANHIVIVKLVPIPSYYDAKYMCELYVMKHD